MQRYTPVEQQQKISNAFGTQHIRFPSETKEQTTSGYEEYAKKPAPQQSRLRTSSKVIWMVLICLLAGTYFVRLVVKSLPQSQQETPQNAIVLASYRRQNTSWLEDISPDWRIHKYTLDDPSPTINTTVPRNQGREAMAYLTHIITNYDNLAPYTIFLHGHARAWHQPEPTAWKIRALNLDLLATEGYINLRCGLKPGCSADTILGSAHPEPRDHPEVRSIMPAFWAWNFQPEHGRWDLGAYPSELGQPCCAQFAVTRERILARPKEFYEAYRRPMERDVREMQRVFGPLWTGYRMGVLYEHLWHVVFGKEALFCPDARFCREVVFRDQVRCADYTGDYEHRAGWRKIQCQNAWDSEGMDVETGEVDRYGGWDGVKDLESDVQAVDDIDDVAATNHRLEDVPDNLEEMEAAAAVIQNYAAKLQGVADGT